MKDASREAENMRDKFSTPWKLLPKPVRKTIVLIVGSTLIVTGILLIVLPGPFTIPLLILGLLPSASRTFRSFFPLLVS